MAVPEETENKFTTVIKAWKSLRKDKSFAKMTLDEFIAKVQPSITAREVIDDLKNQMIAALDVRDKADVITSPVVASVVAAVKGDVDEGEDGELYEAMGYVRKSERKSGLAKKAASKKPA